MEVETPMLISKPHEWTTLRPAYFANRYELIRTNWTTDNWFLAGYRNLLFRQTRPPDTAEFQLEAVVTVAICPVSRIAPGPFPAARSRTRKQKQEETKKSFATPAAATEFRLQRSMRPLSTLRVWSFLPY